MTENHDGAAEGRAPEASTAGSLEANAAPALPGKPDGGGPVRRWMRSGWRVLTFRSPAWAELDARPATVVLLAGVSLLYLMAAQRLFVAGPASFYGMGLLNGWASTAICLWLYWVVSRSHLTQQGPQPSVATACCTFTAAALLQSVLHTIVLLPIHRYGVPVDEWPDAWRWVNLLLPLIWSGLAQVAALWRLAGTPAARGAAVLLVPAALAISGFFQPIVVWWPKPQPEEGGYKGLSLTEDVVMAQPQLMAQALARLTPSDPGKINVYAITYAPYASQDVFMKESATVADTLAERFGAGGRTVQLVMNPATADQFPWAVQTHLRKTIAHMARMMDREHDVLFLHLTSHGARDGKLAVDAWPLESEPVTPALLRQWLDEAGVRWRVLSISACFAGSWIEPLATEDTLVMTAADATHTSYGCGARSPLTFFGQALYVDALHKTWSFRKAHAEARLLIDAREKAAGKKDGYSNPQIREGAGITKILDRLEAQQQGR